MNRVCYNRLRGVKVFAFGYVPSTKQRETQSQRCHDLGRPPYVSAFEQTKRRPISGRVKGVFETSAYQMWCTEWAGGGPVTISILTPILGMPSKSSIGSSSGPESNPYRYVASFIL